MLKRFAGWIALSLLVGCATDVVPVATGGSRSDGIVEMSYEYGSMTTPNVNRSEAIRAAVRRCKTWGYDGAEAFDAGLSSCVYYSAYGCNRYRVTTEYQCVHTSSKPETPTARAAVPGENPNYREELQQIQDSMSCNNGARIVSKTEESVKWELDCGDGETLEVRCFDNDCYLR